MTTNRCAKPCPTCSVSSASRHVPFASAEELLTSDHLAQAACLVLDVAMPGMTGPELQMELKARGCRVPIVFITAHTGEGLLARLTGQGAVACLTKPFSDIELLDAVTAALSPAQ